MDIKDKNEIEIEFWKKSKNESWILFDIDLIKNISTYVEFEKSLASMKIILNSEKILNIINSFLEKNGK